MGKVSISVVIPVYNNEKYFPMAVQSVLEQDFQDWEMIIVDDGSTDLTPEIADTLAKKDSRIHIVHQKNQWIYASMNHGIDLSTGDYVYILNSDDRLYPGSLKLLSETIRKYNNPDVIWTKVLSHVCDEEQKIIKYDYAKLDKKVTKEIFYNILQLRKSWPFFLESFLAQNQANLYKRTLIQKYRFRNDVYGADTLFNIDIAPDVETAVVLPKAVYAHFVYYTDNRNVSVGKYYSYEHDMFNDIYIQYKNLFHSWELPIETYQELLGKQRLSQITSEVRALLFENCPLSTEEKIKRIYLQYVDKVVYQCASELGRIEELESRILSGTKELLLKENISEQSDMYFVYEMLEAMLCYEKDKNDYDRMKKAIYHPLNPYHIGKTFYEKLTKMNL